MYQRYFVEMENGQTLIREEGKKIEPGSPWSVAVMAVRGSFCVVCLEDEKGNLAKEKINENYAIRVMSSNNSKGMKDYPMSIRKHMDLFTTKEKNLIKQKRTYPDGSTFSDPNPDAERARRVFGTQENNKFGASDKKAPETAF